MPWREDSRDMLHYDDDKACRDVEIIDAKVLPNRKPPSASPGSLRDALKPPREMYRHAHANARRLFLELEGDDIYSAAGIATARSQG